MTRTIVLTGATSGIGREAALQLAAPGTALVLVGRRPDALAEVARACGAAASVSTHVADLSSQSSVRDLAADLLTAHARIDVLALNAGGVSAARTETVDGIETTFATNHLGTFLLAELLKDRLIASAPSRIVITSSVAHYSGTLDLTDLGYASGYTILKAYRRSKLANVLYARHLAAELADRGVEVVSFHPGDVATAIWSGAPWWARPALALYRLRMVSAAVGGARLVRVVDGPVQTGAYYSNDVVTEPSLLAQNDSVAARLVAVSRELAGL